jgi:hypothetical protein
MNPVRLQKLLSAARTAFLITFVVWFLAKNYLPTTYFAILYALSFAGAYVAKRGD